MQRQCDDGIFNSLIILNSTHYTRCTSSLDALKPDSVDEQKGVEIVRKALSTPCATIAKNAGVDPSIVVQKVSSAENTSEGYDALHDRYVDMIEEGERGMDGCFSCMHCTAHACTTK